jgi:hypothetical protein
MMFDDIVDVEADAGIWAAGPKDKILLGERGTSVSLLNLVEKGATENEEKGGFSSKVVAEEISDARSGDSGKDDRRNDDDEVEERISRRRLASKDCMMVGSADVDIVCESSLSLPSLDRLNIPSPSGLP